MGRPLNEPPSWNLTAYSMAHRTTSSDISRNSPSRLEGLWAKWLFGAHALIYLKMVPSANKYFFNSWVRHKPSIINPPTTVLPSVVFRLISPFRRRAANMFQFLAFFVASFELLRIANLAAPGDLVVEGQIHFLVVFSFTLLLITSRTIPIATAATNSAVSVPSFSEKGSSFQAPSHGFRSSATKRSRHANWLACTSFWSAQLWWIHVKFAMCYVSCLAELLVNRVVLEFGLHVPKQLVMYRIYMYMLCMRCWRWSKAFQPSSDLWRSITHLANGPWNKSLNFISNKNKKLSHWPTKIILVGLQGSLPWLIVIPI